MHVDAIQNAIVLAEVSTSEWEAGANSTGVHVASNLQLIHELWQGAVKGLLLLAGGNLGINQLLTKYGLDLVCYELKFVHTAGVNSKVQTKTEESLFPNLELIAHFFGILNGGLLTRVTGTAFFGIDLKAGFQLSYLFAEVF